MSEVEIGMFSKLKEQSEQKCRVKYEAVLETMICIILLNSECVGFAGDELG